MPRSASLSSSGSTFASTIAGPANARNGDASNVSRASRLFREGAEELRGLKARVERRTRYLHQIRLNPAVANRRNDACPCGSGKRQRQCCAAPGADASYLLHA